MDVEAEIRDLKRRVGELEGGFGFLTNQLRDVHRDLLGFQQQTNERFDGVDGEIQELKTDVRGVKADVRELKSDVRGLKADVGVLKADVTGLREDLPGIVGGAVREALREPR